MTQSLQWLAGFFDADGSLGVYQHRPKARNPYWVLRATVWGLHRGSVEAFCEAFGGNPLYWNARNNGSKPGWRWTATSRKAIDALQAMLPYLVVKREQAELALTFPFREAKDARRPLDGTTEARRAEIAANLMQMKREIA